MRERLPDTRNSITHKAVIHSSPNVEFFITVGLYPDGRLGELFLTMNDVGSDLRGWLNVWAVAISLCLQSEVPLEKIIEKFAYQQFDPQGMTDCEDIRITKSIPDYVVRWMSATFAPKSEKEPKTSVLPVPGPSKP